MDQAGKSLHRPSAPEQESRLGRVVLHERFLEGPPELGQTDEFRKFQDKIEAGRRVVEKLETDSPFLREDELRDILERALARSRLDGLLVATRDGFIVAQASRTETNEILPIIGSLIEQIAERTESEGVMRRLDELVLRGMDGELVAVRYFRETGQDFFLMAYARQRCAYRRETNKIVRQCGPLLVRIST